MDLHYFNLLGQQKQLDITMREGVYLMSYRRYNVIIRLFQINCFYVEIFSLYDDGEVIMVNAFEDMKNLEPYLERVDVSTLI